MQRNYTNVRVVTVLRCVATVCDDGLVPGGLAQCRFYATRAVAAAAGAEPHRHTCLPGSGDALGAVGFRPAAQSSKLQVCGAERREFRSAGAGADGQTAPRGGVRLRVSQVLTRGIASEQGGIRSQSPHGETENSSGVTRLLEGDSLGSCALVKALPVCSRVRAHTAEVFLAT